MEETKNESEQIVVDLALKTEEDYHKWLNTLAATAPVWFNYMSWVLLMGAVSYFQKVAKSTVVQLQLGVVSLVSLFLIWGYTWRGLLFRVRFTGIPFCKTPKHARMASLLLSAVLAASLTRVSDRLATLAMEQTQTTETVQTKKTAEQVQEQNPKEKGRDPKAPAPMLL